MSGRRGNRPPTFADVVREVAEEPPQPTGTEVLSLANQTTFVDSDGVRWHRRGDQRLTGKELARRLRDTDLVVLHEYMEETVLVQAADRQSFWAAAEQRMRDSVHADFYGVEFKSDSHTRLLVVHEDC